MAPWKPLLLASVLLAPVARAGGDGVGNGGDALSLEFIARGRQVEAYLAAQPSQQLLTPAQLQVFATALNTTTVETVETQLYDCHGVAVDAHVLPCPGQTGTPYIQLYRPNWEDYDSRQANVYSLVFHEYLWVIGVDDTNYVVSSQLPLGTGALQLIAVLPNGTFQGSGTWWTDAGPGAAYQVTTTIQSNYVASNYGADGAAEDFTGIYAFAAGSFVNLYADGVAAPVGSGQCNDVQCAFSIPAFYDQHETWTLTPGTIQRLGTRVVNGVTYYWSDTVTSALSR